MIGILGQTLGVHSLVIPRGVAEVVLVLGIFALIAELEREPSFCEALFQDTTLSVGRSAAEMLMALDRLLCRSGVRATCR